MHTFFLSIGSCELYKNETKINELNRIKYNSVETSMNTGAGQPSSSPYGTNSLSRSCSRSSSQSDQTTQVEDKADSQVRFMDVPWMRPQTARTPD